MDIKAMNYSTVSGGTFTYGVIENGKLKYNEIGVPSNLGDLVSLLETRIGDTVNTIAFQLCSTQHLSEERIIINYVVDPETRQTSKIILNVSDMSTDETNKYNEIKSDLGI